MNTPFRERLNESLAPLKERFIALQPRERWIIVAGSILVVLVALYTLGIAPLHKAVARHTQNIARKQQDLAWMQGIAPQLSVLGNAQPRAAAGESLVVVIANSASRGNVAGALTGQTPDGLNGVRIRFEGVSFDALVLWLAALQKEYGIQVKAADINRGRQTGQVNASLTLIRA